MVKDLNDIVSSDQKKGMKIRIEKYLEEVNNKQKMIQDEFF